MKPYHRGINLIELLIAITITAIIAVPMVNVLRSMLTTWTKGSNQLESIKTATLLFNPLVEKLRFASSINLVSLTDNNGCFNKERRRITTNNFLLVPLSIFVGKNRLSVLCDKREVNRSVFVVWCSPQVGFEPTT